MIKAHATALRRGIETGARLDKKGPTMAANAKPVNWLMGLVGAAIGGTAGYFGFDWLLGQGLYAIVLPGALLGMGCGALSGIKSTALGVISGVLALGLGFFCEWKFFPFAKDESLQFFLAHVSDLKGATLILIGVGTLLGFWFGMGREGGGLPRRENTAE